MRTSVEENLSTHSYDVAVLAHALAMIGNKFYGKHVYPEHVACMALFHDASEIITGDMPTPVKYSSPEMTRLFHGAEQTAVEILLKQLPEEMQAEYRSIMLPNDNVQNMIYIKAADKLSALIKCQEELVGANNMDFESAYQSCSRAVHLLENDCPELAYFMEHCYPAYGKTLDQLQSRDTDGQ